MPGTILGAGIVDVVLAVGRDLRARVGEAGGAAAIDGQHVVLAGLDVPHADHGDQPGALLLGEVLRLGEVLVEVGELPAVGVELGQHVVCDRVAELAARLR